MKLCIKMSSLLVLSAFIFATAYADEVRRNDTVMSRPKPDYDPLGVRLGSFNLVPELTVDYVQDDNIRAGEDIKFDDSILLLAPAVELKSDWTKHELAIGAKALDASYDEYSNEDFTDYEYWADGFFESESSKLSAEVRHRKLHELRTNPNDDDGLEPTEYKVDSIKLNYRFVPNRFFVALGTKFSDRDYDPTVNLPPPFGPGGTTDNGDRDRDILDTQLRLGYQVSPGYSLFTEYRFYNVDYDDAVDRDGVNRDADGYEILVGTEVDISSVVFGEFFFGYRSFDYDDPGFENQDGAAYGAEIDWNLTRLSTLSFLASQTLQGTTLQGASGIDTVELKVSADHELRRNIILNLEVDYRNEDFQGLARKDEVWRFRAGGEYFLNRNLSLNCGYRYQKRNSRPWDADVTKYRINQFYLGFRAQI
jgi:hypothetical protein